MYSYGQAKAGRPARTCIQQRCEDTGCSPEDLPEAMNDREKWREKIKDIRAGGTTWWWWWSLMMMRVNFYLLRTFPPHLGSFCVVSSFTTFRPNFTSGLLQVIFPRPRIGMLSLVTVSPAITAFHSCCLSYHVFDQVNLWPEWVGFETAIEPKRLNASIRCATGPEGRSRMVF